MSDSLAKSTLTVSALTMLSRILGLVRDMVLMNVFGAGWVMDAFLVAFKIPNFLRRLFAEGAFSQAFVPVLSEYKSLYGLTAVQILVSRVSGVLMLMLAALTTVVILLAPQVITVFAPGFITEVDKAGENVEKFALATALLRVTFPYLWFISLTAFAGSVLQSYQRFAAPAVAPVLLNVAMITAALWVAPLCATPIMAVGYSVAVAGLLQLGLQLPQLYEQKLLVAPKLDFAHAGMRRILRLLLPAMFGVSVTQINMLLNTVFASLMQTGSVSWLYAAERLSELPLGLIGVAIGTVILPNLATHQTNQDSARFRATLDWAARLVFLVGLPASIAMFMLSDVLMQALFMQGEFGLRDAMMSGLALKGLSGGILGFMLIKIFAPAFFARQNSTLPVRIGVVCVIANVIFSVIFMAIYRSLQLSPHGGLALATSVASLLNAGLLYYYLHTGGIFRFLAHWRRLFMQFFMSNAAMTAALWAMTGYFPLHGSHGQRLLALAGFCVVGAAVYAVTLLGMGVRAAQFKHQS